MAAKGACNPTDVQAGTIRKDSSRSQVSLWLRFPLVAAKKAVEDGSIQIGWTKAKLEILEARLLRCFKCLAKGHVRETCPDT